MIGCLQTSAADQGQYDVTLSPLRSVDDVISKTEALSDSTDYVIPRPLTRGL